MRGLAAALVLSFGVLVATSRPPRALVLTSATSAVPDADVVRVLARSHLAMVTDLYWIRMTALGARANRPDEGRALIAWGEFVTDLDPTMFWAYAMGGILGGMRLGGVSYNGAEAVHLLEKGTRHLDDPRLFIYCSYAQLNLLDDPEGAAGTLMRGATKPGAPPFMAALATRLLAQEGHFERARTFAETMAQSEDPTTRETFELRLKEIERERVLTQVEAAAQTYAQRFGHVPASLATLVAEGLLAEYPVDPLGGSISLAPDGQVTVTSGARLRVFKSIDEEP
ncbi:MAG: hypothetical protein AB1938_25140 [Myxococcota bacterium]